MSSGAGGFPGLGSVYGSLHVNTKLKAVADPMAAFSDTEIA
jgi:hypothetical protein